MRSYSYMHYVSFNDYIMKVIDKNEVFHMCYVDAWSVKVSGLMKSLISMCEVMGLHMYIALVD